MSLGLLVLLYTDPGSGMLMLQLAAVAVSSVAFYFRKAWLKLFSHNNQKPEKARRDDE